MFPYTTTYVQPAPITTYVQQPVAPTATTTYTQTPFGMQQQTTYAAAPAPSPSESSSSFPEYGPYGTTVTQMAAPVNRAIMCAQCRATFTTAVSSAVVSCPYCFFVNQSGVPPVTTVSYAAPPPPMATTTVSYGAPAVFY